MPGGRVYAAGCDRAIRKSVILQNRPFATLRFHAILKLSGTFLIVLPSFIQQLLNETVSKVNKSFSLRGIIRKQIICMRHSILNK